VAVIAPAIKGRISAVTRELQRADHTVIETRMTHTVNKSSPGIYALGDRQEIRGDNQEKREKKEIHNQTSY